MRNMTLVISLIFVALFVQFSSGLNYILVPLAMIKQNFSESFVGIALAFEILATVILFKKMSDLVRHIGMARTLIYASMLRFSVVLWYAQINERWLWLVAIFVYGLATALILVVVQTWLNTQNLGKAKGLFMGLYSSALSCGIAAAPVAFYVYTSLGITEFSPFYIGAVGTLIPVLLLLPSLGKAPTTEKSKQIRFGYIFGNSKRVMLSALAGGVCFYGLPSFLTIYGIRNKMEAEQAGFLMTMFMLGSVSLGLIGSSVSAFINTGRLVLIYMAVSAVCAVFLSLVVYTDYIAALILLFVWGGCMGSIYAIGLTIIGEHFRQKDQVSANVSYVLMDSLGGLFGLCVIGVAIDYFSVEGLSYTIAATCSVYLVYSLISLNLAKSSGLHLNLIYDWRSRQNL
jgi:MFS family permease